MTRSRGRGGARAEEAFRANGGRSWNSSASNGEASTSAPLLRCSPSSSATFRRSAFVTFRI